MSGAVSIAVPGYPSSNLVPGFYFGIDATKANTGTINQRALIIGQMLQTGTLTPNQAIISTGPIQDMAAAGQGSILGLMSAAYNQLDTFTERWLLPLADDPASVAAAGSFTFAGTATQSGTFSPYITDVVVPTLVTTGMTAAQVASAVATAVNAMPTLPVTATSAAAVVTFTAKNKGAVGNDIYLGFNYLGAVAGEAMPAGITCTVTPMSGGTQNPSTLAAALANLGDSPFDFIAFPYNDTVSLDAVKTFLDDQTGRWSIFSEIYGAGLFAFRGTLAQRTTFLATRNDDHVCCMPFEGSPSPIWSVAAWLAASVATSVQEDPALPITGYTWPMLAPPVANRDTLSERQTMLVDGGSTTKVEVDQVVLERVVTTYTTNPATGAPDNSFRDGETLFTLMAAIRDMRTFLSSQYVRKKLVIDGSIVAGGSNQVTAQMILASAQARYLYQCNTLGICQDPAGFNAASLAQNAGGGLVKLLLPFRIANQLRVVGVNVQFSKP